MPTAVLQGVGQWEALPAAALLRAHSHSPWPSAGRGGWAAPHPQQGPQQHQLPQGFWFGLCKANTLGVYKRSMNKHVNYNCPFR